MSRLLFFAQTTVEQVSNPLSFRWGDYGLLGGVVGVLVWLIWSQKNETKTLVDNFRADIKQQRADLMSSLKEHTNEMKAEMKADRSTVKEELKAEREQCQRQFESLLSSLRRDHR